MEFDECIEEAAKTAGLNANDLKNAVYAIVESRLGSAKRAKEYEKMVSNKFDKNCWDFAYKVATWEIERMR